MTRLSALAAMFLAAGSVEAAEQSPWKSLAPFPAPIREAALIGCDGKIYMFTGQGIGYLPLGLVYQYDPATNVWTEKKRMPVASHHIATAEYNGKIYFFGGFKLPETGQFGWDPMDLSWEYDPKNDTWKPLKPMPSKRGAGNAAIVNGKAYVIGGLAVHPGSKNAPVQLGPDDTPRRSVTTNEEYDLATGEWRERSPMPTPRHHLEVIAANGKVFAMGGRQGLARGSVGYTDTVEEYDPATDRWSVSKARMPVAREDMSWGVYDGRIYIVGGGLRSAFGTFESVRAMNAYDPATNQWFTMPSVPPGRAPTSAAVVGDTLYLISNDGSERRAASGGESKPYPFDAIRLSDFFR